MTGIGAVGDFVRHVPAAKHRAQVVDSPALCTPLVARRAWWVGAIAVVLLGFALRAAWYDGPYGHPDEPITIEVVRHMRQSGDWDTNWAKAALEPDLRYDQYNFSSHLYATYFFYRFVKLLPGLEAWRSADDGLAVYRFCAVLLAAAVVAQTVQLGRRAFGPAAALAAGGLAAVSVLLVQDAHFARPEAFVTALTLAAVAACWPRAGGGLAAALGGAFVIGLLVAAQVSLLLLAWLPLVPWLAAGRGEVRRRWHWPLWFGVAIVAGFALGAPGAIGHWDAFVHGIRHLAVQYAGAHPPHSRFDGGPAAGLLARYFFSTLGWPTLACFAFGLFALVRRRQWPALALLVGPVVLFVGYFCTRTVFFERNLSHVVPLFLLVAAAGMVEVARVVSTRARWQAATLVLIAGAATVRPLWLVARLDGRAFSGDEGPRAAAFDDAIRARFPAAQWRTDILLTPAPLVDLATHFHASMAPVLLRADDFHDDWTSHYVAELEKQFVVQLVAVDPGLFPDVPTCTLLTYQSTPHVYFLISGSR